jgi:hypothetical protein
MEKKRDRVEHHTPEPDENTTYKDATTVTEDEHPRLPSPPQESGTMIPKT